MNALNALLGAIHLRLSTDPALAALIGPDGVRDRLLARPALPAVVFGEVQTRDYSTATEAGEEHRLTLEVWSRAPGRREGRHDGGRLFP